MARRHVQVISPRFALPAFGTSGSAGHGGAGLNLTIRCGGIEKHRHTLCDEGVLVFQVCGTENRLTRADLELGIRNSIRSEPVIGPMNSAMGCLPQEVSGSRIAPRHRLFMGRGSVPVAPRRQGSGTGRAATKHRVPQAGECRWGGGCPSIRRRTQAFVATWGRAWPQAGIRWMLRRHGEVAFDCVYPVVLKGFTPDPEVCLTRTEFARAGQGFAWFRARCGPMRDMTCSHWHGIGDGFGRCRFRRSAGG